MREDYGSASLTSARYMAQPRVTPEYPDGNVTIGPVCQPCLFNLLEDEEERHNQAAEQPELAAKLAAELESQTHFQMETTTLASTRSAPKWTLSPQPIGASSAPSVQHYNTLSRCFQAHHSVAAVARW